MTPLQIRDWATHVVAAGNQYELVYLVRGGNGANRATSDKDFRSILDQRPGVDVFSVQSVGPDVVRAVVSIGYQGQSLLALLGASIYTNVGTRSEVQYQLTNVFLLREGNIVNRIFEPLTKLAESADLAVGKAAISASDTLEDLNLSPTHLTLYLAIAIGVFLWTRSR